MTRPTVAIGIIHAAHARERWAMMALLMRELRAMLPQWVTHFRVHSETEGPRQWARRSWRWAVETGADFSVILNDDVVLAPCWWDALGAMLEVLPGDVVLGLGTVDPAQAEAHARGERWLRNGHGVVGWAVGMWMHHVRMLAREEAKLPADHRSPGHDECKPGCELWHEDSWANAVLAEHGIAVWHPIPSIVQHDTSMRSMYGNDHHKTRTAPVTWEQFDITSPAFWRP